MKLCMIGLRGHNNYVFKGLHTLPDVRVEGVCAGTPEDDAESLCAAITGLNDRPCPPVFEDYRHMLERIKPDAVTIAGPFETHARMCIEALDRGIAVFCEKPVSTSLADLDRLKTAQARSGRLLIGMMGMRYDPAFYAAWLAVRRGAVGSIRLIDARKSYKLGRRAAYYHARETYGGTIPWVGSHAIDWIHWFAARPFESVQAAHSTRGNRGHGDMEVSALCQFRLAGDLLAACSIDVLRPETAPTHGDDRLRVVGDTGVIEVQQGETRLIEPGHPGEQLVPPADDGLIFADFMAEIEGRSVCRIRPEDTFAVTEAFLLARLSADNHETVAFPKTSGS